MDRTPLASEHCDPRWVQVHIYNLSEKLEALMWKKMGYKKGTNFFHSFCFSMDFEETSFFHFSMMKFMNFQLETQDFCGCQSGRDLGGRQV